MHTTVLSSIASRCQLDLGETVWAYVQEVRLLPGYTSEAVTDDDLQSTARELLDLLLRLLAGEAVESQLASRSEGVGRRRARQGLALDSLLRAVRMNFRFLWRVLRREAVEEEVIALAEEVVTVWDAVELHTSRIQVGYIAEMTQMHRDLELERTSLLRGLLAGTSSDPVQLEHVATAFGLRMNGRFQVLVASPRFSRQFRRKVERLGLGKDVIALDGSELVILDEVTLNPRMRSVLSTVPGGLSPIIDGPAGLAAAWQVARRLADHVESADSNATVLTHWEHLVVEGIGPIADLFRVEQLAALDALPAERREPMIDAVREYLSCGSVSASAGRLFLHRNTMINRLQRFTDLTGLDVSIPSDAGTVRWLLRDEL